MIVALYPLYALQRGQLSLLWSTLSWQFFDRPGSGSLLDTRQQDVLHGPQWVSTDPWLLIGGFVAALLTLASRRLRPFGCALLLQLVVLIHGGYLPFFYVTAVVPFAAVCIAGTADSLWARRTRPGCCAARRPGSAGAPAVRALPRPGGGRARRAVVAGCRAAEWVELPRHQLRAHGNVPYLAAAAWAERNVPQGDVVVVDDYLWVDLKTHGLDPLWLWKINPQTAPDWRDDPIHHHPAAVGGHAGRNAGPAGRLRALRPGEELRRRPYRPPGDRGRLTAAVWRR